MVNAHFGALQVNKNHAMTDRMRAVLTPNYSPQPVHIERGEGCYVFDAEGRRYLDMMGGIATAVLGHCHPAVQAALAEQSGKLWHISNLVMTSPQVELAERLTELCFATQVFFANSGAEANEAALKLARRYAHDRGEKRFNLFIRFYIAITRVLKKVTIIPGLDNLISI